MTGRSTTTMTIRLSPQLKAEFGRIQRAKGGSVNHALVDLIRGVCVGERREGGK